MARKPWYTRGRYGLLLLATAVVVTGVVALKVQGPDATSPGRETGSANAEAPDHVSTPGDRLYDEAYGWFEPITMTGTGTTTIPLPEDSTAGIVTAYYDNHGYFDVEFLFPHDRSTSLIATPGPYRGTVAYGPHTIGDEKMPDSLRVWTTGAWEVTVAPISSAEQLPPTASGVDAVFLYDGDGAVLVVEHQDRRDRVLSVLQWRVSPRPGQDFPVTPKGFAYLKTDRYSETVRLAPGPSVVTIDAFGRWSARLK